MDGDGEGQAARPRRAPPATERAAQAADIARRRAAHFARFEDEGDDDADEVQVGGENVS